MITVRIATEEDLDDVLSIGHRTWPSTYGPIAGDDYVRRGLDRWWSEAAVLPAIRAARTLVAERSGTVVGMATFVPVEDTLLLSKLYVVPEEQGSGAGSLLLEAVLMRARAGFSELRVEVVDGNHRAEAFYRAKGFLRHHSEPGPLEGPDDVCLVMEL